MGHTCIETAASFVSLTLVADSARRISAALRQPPRFNAPCSVSSKPSSLHCSLSCLWLRWGSGLRVHKWMMVQLSSVPGSREGESRCKNCSLAKIHTHGGHWAELSVGVFVSQVKKLLKRREIHTRSILGDAQRRTLHACPTVFIAFIEVQERSFTEGAFCLPITVVLGSACRFHTIVTCPLICLTVWELNKPSPWGRGNLHIQVPLPLASVN